MSILEKIVTQIEGIDVRHGIKMRTNIESIDPAMREKGEQFLEKYLKFCKEHNKTLDYGVESYIWMINMMMYEQVQLVSTGEYSCKSFADANERVYNNPEVMEKYMHGLMLSQFLWKHHCDVFDFFLTSIASFKGKNVKSYLEIGGGHGLFLSEAIDILGSTVKYDCLDISNTSLEIAKGFIDSNNVNYIHSNIFDYKPEVKYDLITMGEVIEHVEDPVSLINSLIGLLNPDGQAFITTPTNAGTLDHIYLFRNKQEILDVIDRAGFEVVSDFDVYSEDVTFEKAEKYKVPMMYAALIKPKK